MCVTPNSVIMCDDGLRVPLTPYMVDLPDPPPVFLQIPAQRWRVDILPDSLTIGNPGSLSGSSLPWGEIGDPLDNLFHRSVNKTFLLSPVSRTHFRSAYKRFGTTSIILNFKGWSDAGILEYEKTVVREYSHDIRFSLGIVNRSSGVNYCAFGLTYEILKTADAMTTPLGTIDGPNNSSRNFYWNWFTYTDISATAFVKRSIIENNFPGQLDNALGLPAGTEARYSWRIDTPSMNSSIQNPLDFRSTWDPFEFFLIAIGKGPFLLHRSVTYDVLYNFSGNRSATVTATTSPSKSFGSVFKLTPILPAT
jgi:hypothetical protein